MSNELATLQELPLVEGKYSTPQALTTLTSAAYLPRIQVMGGNNDIVKEGKFPIGHFALVTGKSMDDLTAEFNAVILSWRPKAMQFQPDVVSYYDPNSEGFKKLQERADSEPQSGCGYGPEYLLWLPDYEKFATLFCSNKTTRNEAPNIHTFMRKACTFIIELIKSKKYTWHGLRVGKCDLEVKLSPQEVMMGIVDKFNSPPETETEIVEPESESRER